jgi:hypothetical protein
VLSQVTVGDTIILLLLPTCDLPSFHQGASP